VSKDGEKVTKKATCFEGQTRHEEEETRDRKKGRSSESVNKEDKKKKKTEIRKRTDQTQGRPAGGAKANRYGKTKNKKKRTGARNRQRG